MTADNAKISLDAFDRRILAALAVDSDVTSAVLGDQIGLSASATHRRIAQLRERGAIKGYRAVLSHSARGEPTSVMINVTLRDQRQETMSAFEAEAAQCPEIAECYLMSGEADYLLHVEVPREDTFERIHREVLARLPCVTRLASHFVIRAVVGRD